MNHILSSASDLISGLLNNMLAQLASKDNERWLKIYQLMSRAKVQDIMRALEIAVFKFWKKILIGGKTKEDLLRLLVSGGHWVGPCIVDFLKQPDCPFTVRQAEPIQFVMGDLEELFGPKVKKKTREFLNEEFLSKFDLEFCELSDAFYLRLAYSDQPVGNWLHVGMKPASGLIHTDGDSGVFCLGNDSNGTQLDTSNANPERWWGDFRFFWVFRRKKNTSWK